MAQTMSICQILVVLAISSRFLCAVNSDENEGLGTDSVDIFDYFEDVSNSVSGDFYAYVGRQLELVCTLDKSWTEAGWTSENISFKHSQPIQLKPVASGCMDAWTRVFNSTTAGLVINNVTLDNAGQYLCVVGNGSCFQGTRVSVANDVFVEYPPHNVTNVSCVVKDWTDAMICTWTHPVKYKAWDATHPLDNISVTLISEDKKGNIEKYSKLNRTFCEWEIGKGFSASPEYTLKISVTDGKTQEVAQKEFKVDAWKSVQPSPIEFLEIKELSDRKGCVELAWSHNRNLREIIFRVRHRSGEGEPFRVLANVTHNGLTADVSKPYIQLYLKCGYKPMTFHEFAVDCYPGGKYSGYWSLPRMKEFTTAPTAPGEGPQVTEGSYVSSGICKDKMRSVVVMWNEVKKEEQNGIITDVSIWAAESGSLIWKGPSNRYHAKLELGCHKIALQLFAHNGAGKSIVPSEITIPSVEGTGVPLLLQESFSVEMDRDGNKLRAVWDPYSKANSSNPHSSTFTIFWCHRKWPSKTCSGPTFWQLVPPCYTSLVIPVSISDATEYLYGLSVQNLDTFSSSQIFWTDCLYDKFITYLPAPDNIELEAGSERIKVRWDLVLCTYTENIKVDEYSIKWQKVDDADKSVYEKTVPKSQSAYAIEELQEATQYLVSVQSESSNKRGEQSVWKKTMTLKKETGNSYNIIGLAAGLAVLGVILVAVFVICCLYFRKHKKVFKKGEKVQDLLGSPDAKKNSSGKYTQKGNSPESAKVEERQESQVSAPVTNDASTTNLTEDDDLDTQICGNLKAYLVSFTYSRLGSFMRLLKIGPKQQPVVNNPTVNFTNIRMGDQAINIDVASEPDVTSPGTDEEQEGDQRTLQAEIARVSQSSDAEHSSCERNVNPYLVLDNNMGFSELPAPPNIESYGESQQGESVSSYIQVDFDQSTDNSQAELISMQKQKPLHTHTNVIAMRVEEENFRSTRNTRSPFDPDVKASLNIFGAAVLPVDKPVNSTPVPPLSDNPDEYVRHGNTHKQVLTNGNCITENFHDDSDISESSEEIFQNFVQDKEAAASPEQQMDTPMAATSTTTQARDATDCVSLASGTAFDSDPGLLPCTSQTTSSLSDCPCVSKNALLSVIIHNSQPQSVFTDPPYVSNTSQGVIDNISQPLIDLPYVSNTSPAVTDNISQPHFDLPCVSTTLPSVINNNFQPSQVPIDPPYVSNTSPSIINHNS